MTRNLLHWLVALALIAATFIVGLSIPLGGTRATIRSDHREWAPAPIVPAAFRDC